MFSFFMIVIGFCSLNFGFQLELGEYDIKKKKEKKHSSIIIYTIQNQCKL